MKISLKPGAFGGAGAPPFLGSAGLPPAALPPEIRALIALMSLRVFGDRFVRNKSSQTF
jgi:hypothetical protein